MQPRCSALSPSVWLLQIHFTYDFPYLWNCISLSITLCLQDLLQNHPFSWFPEMATLAALRGFWDSSFPSSTDSITCWKDRRKFGWDNDFQTCRKWQKTLPLLLALGLPWRICCILYVQKPSIFFQPERGLCLIKGNNKIRKDQVQFSKRHSSVLHWLVKWLAIFWLVHKMVAFGIKKGNSEIPV